MHMTQAAKDKIKNKKVIKTTVIQTRRPPILGVPTSFSLCKLLKTTASSPEIAFCLADFFQSWCLYKKFVSNGHQKIATAEAMAAELKTLITLKTIVVIFYLQISLDQFTTFFISENLSSAPKTTLIKKSLFF